MEAVATGNDGFVAVGPSLEDGAAIWTSSDGIAWRSVSDRALEGLAGPDYGVGATGVVARDGTVVVVGYASLADDSTVALAWSSRAGGPWTRSEILGSEPGSSSIIATADGFLASGWPGDCPAWIWASNDGRTWRCDATEPKMKDFIPVAIAASGSIDVAVGWTENADTTAWYRTRR
jgi:hypothetical protein